MRLLVIGLFSFLLCSCQMGNAEAETTAPTRDSIPPKRSYMVETSRPVEKISPQFPFDIAMTNPKGESTNSSKELVADGKPTVLLFWLTTCPPCRIELNAVKKNYENWQKEADFNLFAISTDFPNRYPQFVKYVEENNWPFPAFHDTNREFKKVMPGGLNGLPQVFVLDAEGEVVYHKRKYSSGDEHKLFDKVKEIAAIN